MKKFITSRMPTGTCIFICIGITMLVYNEVHWAVQLGGAAVIGVASCFVDSLIKRWEEQS